LILKREFAMKPPIDMAALKRSNNSQWPFSQDVCMTCGICACSCPVSGVDGFDPRLGIVLLAATNRPEILDPALLRAGRFDRQVLVDRPERIGRIAILKIHLNGVQLADDVDVDAIAAALQRIATGADRAVLVFGQRRGDARHQNDRRPGQR